LLRIYCNKTEWRGMHPTAQCAPRHRRGRRGVARPAMILRHWVARATGGPSDLVPCGTHPRSSPCQPPSIGESDEGDESMKYRGEPLVYVSHKHPEEDFVKLALDSFIIFCH